MSGEIIDALMNSGAGLGILLLNKPKL